MDMKGTVAVVTGGNGGLGQRICHALAAQGCHIAVVYAQSKEQAAGVARDLERHQVSAATFACDVTQRDQVQRLVDDVVKRFGRLDILINDAAYNKAIPFPDLDNLTYEEWTKIIDINLTGPMLTTKAVAPVMKHQGCGRIVNISSVAGLGPQGSSIAYAVSKAGLIHLTKCMAVALAPEVLVNCVAPGLLEGTRATSNLRPEQIENSAKTSLLRKAADKDDVADQVVTMCRTNTMTGQTVVIDSGRTFPLSSRFLAHVARRHGITVAMQPGRGRTPAQGRLLVVSSFESSCSVSEGMAPREIVSERPLSATASTIVVSERRRGH